MFNNPIERITVNILVISFVMTVRRELIYMLCYHTFSDDIESIAVNALFIRSLMNVKRVPVLKSMLIYNTLVILFSPFSCRAPKDLLTGIELFWL